MGAALGVCVCARVHLVTGILCLYVHVIKIEKDHVELDVGG